MKPAQNASAHALRASWKPRLFFRRRPSPLFFVCAAVFLVFLIARMRTLGTADPVQDSPPGADAKKLLAPRTFVRLREEIRGMPQHNVSLPPPEGKHGRYVKFSNEGNWVGWNNCLNERLVNMHLAYVSNRGYVFSEYYWAHEHWPWRGREEPEGGARTPLPAMLSGPIVGGSWGELAPSSPRSISSEWFDVVCPTAERKIINTASVKPNIPDDASGLAILEHWRALLAGMEDRCVEIVPPAWEVDDKPQIFNLWVWGSTKVLSLWEEFHKSPVSTLLGPSETVRKAVARNKEQLFQPRWRWWWNRQQDPFNRTLAVHVRRGDYIGHCKKLAEYGSSYYSWALLPQLLDKFASADIPSGAEREAAVLQHCLPTAEQLVSRIEEVRREYVEAERGRVLDVLYVLTNDNTPWLDDVKRTLRAAGWRIILTTRDLELDDEEREVGMAVDMQFAREAAVFLGNGWSSFTSNIIHQRIVDGREALGTRLT
ncbi:hypothetical protein MKEN_00262000 [Mycena kentingensis (nom. inval.)]|nr:hypothetical protein MKEN_00262000 [Mycena kentingensis (nom. inval.)]